MHIASFMDRKFSSGFSMAPRPPLKRGQILIDDQGDMFFVWSVSLGIAHVYELHQDHFNDGSNVKAKFTVVHEGEVFSYDMWLDAETRRHLDVQSVHAYQCDTADLLVALTHKLRQIERRENSLIRSAYAA
jgi:hypothetical protein